MPPLPFVAVVGDRDVVLRYRRCLYGVYSGIFFVRDTLSPFSLVLRCGLSFIEEAVFALPDQRSFAPLTLRLVRSCIIHVFARSDEDGHSTTAGNLRTSPPPPASLRETVLTAPRSPSQLSSSKRAPQTTTPPPHPSTPKHKPNTASSSSAAASKALSSSAAPAKPSSCKTKNDTN